MAAALASGAGAAVSHEAPLPFGDCFPQVRGPIEVTVPSDGGPKRRPGITIHRSSTLIARDATRRQGVPLTTPARTLRDLRRTVPQPVFRRALRRALDLRLISDADMSDSDLTRSELERLFLGLCRRHRIPQPDVNGRLGPYEVDFLWREASVIVETDGFRHHGNRAAFESDRARDARLQSLGYRVLRFTYRQVTAEQSLVAESIRAVLAGRGRS